MAINYRQYIVRDPAICGGEPVVRGTRVTVRTVLASLAEGMSVAEVVKDFPALDEEAGSIGVRVTFLPRPARQPANPAK